MTIIGASAIIYWNDTPDIKQEVYISFSDWDENNPDTDIYGVDDDTIFFYGSVRDEDDYRRGSEGWTLVEWEFHDNTPSEDYRNYLVCFDLTASWTDYPYTITMIVKSSSRFLAIHEARSLLNSDISIPRDCRVSAMLVRDGVTETDEMDDWL